MWTIDEILKILRTRRDKLKREYDECWESCRDLPPESESFVTRSIARTTTYAKLLEINCVIWEFESGEKLRNLPDEDDADDDLCCMR